MATRPVTGGRIDLVRVGQDGIMTMIDSAETGLDDPAHMALLADRSAIVSAHVSSALLRIGLPLRASI